MLLLLFEYIVLLLFMVCFARAHFYWSAFSCVFVSLLLLLDVICFFVCVVFVSVSIILLVLCGCLCYCVGLACFVFALYVWCCVSFLLFWSSLLCVFVCLFLV